MNVTFYVYWEGGHHTYFADEGNTWGGTPHNIERWEGGHRTYFVDGRNNWGGDTAQHRKTKLSCGWVGGGPSQEMIPLRRSILQAETCQILRFSPSVTTRNCWSYHIVRLISVIIESDIIHNNTGLKNVSALYK